MNLGIWNFKIKTCQSSEYPRMEWRIWQNNNKQIWKLWFSVTLRNCLGFQHRKTEYLAEVLASPVQMQLPAAAHPGGQWLIAQVSDSASTWSLPWCRLTPGPFLAIVSIWAMTQQLTSLSSLSFFRKHQKIKKVKLSKITIVPLKGQSETLKWP